MHSNHKELTMMCSKDWLQAACTPMIIPSLATHMTIGGYCLMVDDHVLLFFWCACCFSILASSVLIKSLSPTQPSDQFFIPELRVQVGIDDVSTEASDPCLT